MTRRELLEFLRSHRHAVQASVAPSSGVQAAVIGIAVADNFEIIFDTVETTRKARNLSRDPRIALVIGGTGSADERTVQCEGVVDRPVGADLQAVRELYFQAFPDGRERLSWPGLVHLRIRPTWLRYSDFRVDPPIIGEWTASDLASLP